MSAALKARRTGPYNGHPSWEYWNVSLWIANDESLYRLALRCLREQPNRRAAADAFIAAVRETHEGHTPFCVPATPDGAPYTQRSVLAALRGMEV